MRIRWTHVFTTIALPMVGLTACGGEVDMTLHEPLAVAPLSIKPGCFSPIVTLAPCDDESPDECEQSREANATMQANISEITTQLRAVVEVIRAAPNDALWSATYTWPQPHELTSTFTITADKRGTPSGAFTISAHDVGTYAPGLDLPTEIDGFREMYGFYTPNFTMVDVGDGVLRWTEHALTAGSFYRGCDPEKNVSFDQRFLDDGTFDLFCWENDGGNVVDCATINLWPK